MSKSETRHKLRGGCQCGYIRYRIVGEPLTLYACHCLDCQAQSASAFGLSMWVNFVDFELQQGELKFWSARADNGSDKQCAFCPNCGTRIYHASDREIISLKAGSLDDKSILQPVAHIWTKRAYEWLGLGNKGVICCTEQPVQFDEILQAWRQATFKKLN
ncbi:MAG: GFA family protein [Gammaproteobacteria bacterium]|nr:GFA family protein [Gammaproteobacteria bacterium]